MEISNSDNDTNPNKENKGLIVCPECNISTPGIVSNDVPWYIYIVGIIGLFIIGKLFLIVVPFLVLTLKNQIRRCPECHDVLEQKNLFSIESLNDQVFTLTLSDVVIVQDRKNAYILSAALFQILCQLYYFSHTDKSVKEMELHINDKKIVFSWEDYIQDCGSKNILNNELRTKNLFITKYQNQEVNWEGYFLEQKIISTEIGRYVATSIKMNPTDAVDLNSDINQRVPYIHRRDYKLTSDLDIQIGQQIKFRGIQKKMGDEDSPHEFQQLEGEKVENKFWDKDNIKIYDINPKEASTRLLRNSKNSDSNRQ